MPEWVMNNHYQTWIAQGRFTNIIRTPSKQWLRFCVISYMDLLRHFEKCYHTTKLLLGILVSLRLSIRLSFHPASHIRSLAPTVLVGSISYLYILSRNFRRCVTYKLSSKITKFEFLAIFCKFVTLLCLVLTWDLMWVTSMDKHKAVGVSQNAGVLVVLVWNRFKINKGQTDFKPLTNSTKPLPEPVLTYHH